MKLTDERFYSIAGIAPPKKKSLNEQLKLLSEAPVDQDTFDRLVRIVSNVIIEIAKATAKDKNNIGSTIQDELHKFSSMVTTQISVQMKTQGQPAQTVQQPQATPLTAQAPAAPLAKAA